MPDEAQRAESELHARATEIFLDLIELEASEREEGLETRCGGDRALLDRVRRMLAAERPGRTGFLEPPAEEDFPAGTAGGLTGKVVGAYTLVRELGRGGMGTVWLGKRDEGSFEHRVAIKLLGGGLFSADAQRRFAMERQFLAGLQHPNIARLLDGGVTPDGLQYIVMDFVQGTAITSYCDRNRLGVRERIALFRKVCDAVQYAHNNLIVHRDLKPSNILVDEAGEPWLLDFGIAKMIADDASLAERTKTDGQVLTPQYASPEQFLGRTITTKSDVYALGLLLYLLLTGRKAYDLGTTPLAESTRLILEEIPRAPSAAVGEAEEEQVVQAFGTTRVRLSGGLRGDLDTIVLKALRKEPERRYATVEQFSNDLLAHLEKRPVGARPDTLRYRLSKSIRRNPGVAASLGALFLILASSTAIVWNQVGVARERLAETKSALGNAEASLAFSKTLVEQALPQRLGKDATVVEALQASSKEIDEILAGRAWAEGSLRTYAGRLLYDLGSLRAAGEQLTAALEARAEEHGVGSGEWLMTYFDLGELRLAEGNAEAAREISREILEWREKRGDRPISAVGDFTLLGEAEIALGNPEAAERAARSGLALLEGIEEPSDEEFRDEVILRKLLGTVLFQQARYEDAEPVFREAYESYVDRFGPGELSTLTLAGDLSTCLQNLGRFDEALELADESLKGSLTLLPPHHFDILVARTNRADLLTALGRHGDAIREYSVVVDVGSQHLGAEHWSIRDARRRRGQARFSDGDLEGATEEFRSLLVDEWQWTDGGDQEALFTGNWYCYALLKLESWEPLAEWAPSLSERSEQLNGEADVITLRFNAWAARSLLALGEAERSVAHFERAVRAADAAGVSGELNAGVFKYYGLALVDAGRREEAVPQLLRCYEKMEEAGDAEPAELDLVREQLATVYEELGDRERAEAWRGNGGHSGRPAEAGFSTTED